MILSFIGISFCSLFKIQLLLYARIWSVFCIISLETLEFHKMKTDMTSTAWLPVMYFKRHLVHCQKASPSHSEQQNVTFYETESLLGSADSKQTTYWPHSTVEKVNSASVTSAQWALWDRADFFTKSKVLPSTPPLRFFCLILVFETHL